MFVRYVAKNHFGSNAIRAQFEQEQQKIKGLMQTSNEAANDSSLQTSLPFLPSTNVQLEVTEFKLLIPFHFISSFINVFFLFAYFLRIERCNSTTRSG